MALAVLAIGAIPLAVGGLHVYMTTTATQLHPEADRVPSTARGETSPAWANAIERGRQVMRAGLAEQNLPGLSVAAGVDGAIVWAEGFGWADLDDRRPVTPETRFRVGTASTVLTSAAVGLLLERQRLDLDADIRTYVPEFPQKEWTVTLRQVMSHTAGLRSDGGDESPLYAPHCDRPDDALRHFAHRPLLFEPGTAHRYSNYGWILVSAAIEAASRQRFSTFMRTQVFEPLQMEDTRLETLGAPVPGASTYYFPRYAADPRYGLHLMRDIDLSCYAGAAAFVSTPSDLVRFGIATLASGDGTRYELGWDRGRVSLGGTPTDWVGTDGATLGGKVASLVAFPDHDLVVAVISNIPYAETTALAVDVAQAFAVPR